jgi:predicted nucleotidyltransferase component of viral defense system
VEKANQKNQLYLTPTEQKHVDFMAEIARSVSDSPTVLKGGTALLLSYGLNRYSEDLDFDSTKPLNLDKRINDAAQKQNINVKSISLKKDTPTTKRYIVLYESEEGAGRLKIETSFRAREIPEQDTTVVNGIKSYRVENLISQKLEALDGRSKVRDIFDVNYLTEKYGADFQQDQLEKLSELTRDPDLLVSRFKADHLADDILKSQSLDDLVLNFQANIEALNILLENKNKVLDKAGSNPSNISKLGFWRRYVQEENKGKPEEAQASALARFDELAKDPEFLKSLEGLPEEKTHDEIQERNSDHGLEL